jgi:hypothetical protein
MPHKQEAAHDGLESTEQYLVLSSLELDQLAEARKQSLPRRRLKRVEVFALSALRLYLLFMIAVVIYQVWTGTH